jgi:hypothetical protein
MKPSKAYEKDKMYFEKIVLFWCECPPVYDENGNQIFSEYPSSRTDKDESFNPELDICDVCGKRNKKKKMIKRKLKNNEIVPSDEVLEYE